MFGDERLPARFWSKVERGALGCWLWSGSQLPFGYGMFMTGSRTDGSRRVVVAHRFAYERLVGPIAAGLQIDHLCSVPPCVNPAHLEPVTPLENTLRRAVSTSPTCKRGHLFTGRRGNGTRYCRICTNESKAARRWARRLQGNDT
jgi:hypothetical protein